MAGDRAQFAIDITAQLTGADSTTTQLDQVAKQLTATGVGAADLEEALRQVSDQLTAAQAAAQATNSAVSDGEQRYRELEKAALKNADAFKKAFAKGDEIAIAKLTGRAEDLNLALAKEAQTLDALRGSAKGAAAEVARLERHETNLQKSLGHVTGRFDRNANALQKLRAGLGDIGGPVGQLGKNVLEPVQAFHELASAFGSARAGAVVATVGVLALVVALAALTAAAIAGVGAVAALGVQLASQARDARLANEAFEQSTAGFEGYGEAAAKAVRETELGDAALRGLSKSLKQAKVSAKDLPVALQAAAIAERALGQGGSAEFIQRLKDGKQTVQSFANEVNSKFGGVVQRQMLGLEIQNARFKRSLAETFGGLNIDPLLAGLNTLVQLFDKGSSTGKALKFIFETAFQPLIDGATAAIPIVEAFFIGILIGALKIYIAMKPAIEAVKEFLGVDDPSTVDWLTAAKVAGEVLVFVIGAMASAFLLTTGIIVGFGTAIAATAVAVGAAAIAIGVSIAEGVQSAITWLQSVDLTELGTQMIQGLINGITGAASGLVTAITGSVSRAITAAKETLGIASPSKVFMQIGENTGEGLTQGVEASSDDAAAAMADLASPPSMASVAASGSSEGTGRAAAGGGPTVVIQSLSIQGVAGAAELAPRLADLLTSILQGDAIQVGASA